jgi:hypothetical protein
MWVIIEKYREAPKYSWISGVFKRLDDAQTYLAESFHEGFHKQYNPTPPLQMLREIPAQEYPVLFIYDIAAADYHFVTEDELVDKIAALEKVDDEDHQYFIYHIFREDYRAINAGAEYVEMIDHHHLDNREIESLLMLGLKVRCVGSLRGIYTCEHCNRLSYGVLSKNGYEPPPGWLIVPRAEVDQEEDSTSPTYLTCCSETCRKLLEESLKELR